MTKFRTSSHVLEIERGRHTKPSTPVDQRNCNVCHVLEDEKHFLLHCQILTDERREFTSRILSKYPHFASMENDEKFIFLLQNKDAQIVTWTAKFIYHSMQKRNNYSQ